MADMADVDYSRLERVIAVANGKGGVLKSSLTANMAALAAAAGSRVLIVDLDPQGDIGDDLGYFDDARDDRGERLMTSLVSKAPLVVSIPDVRPRLDVVTGGPALEDVLSVVTTRERRGEPTTAILARSLEPIAADYDAIFIDTPPNSVELQLLALGAARWLVSPTKADASSIKGLAAIATRLVQTRTVDHRIDLLAIVLAAVPTAAKRLRAEAVDDIREQLGDDYSDALIERTIRDSSAVARQCRSEGVLAHELAEQVDEADPWWKALKEGKTPQRLPGTAPGLTEDYVSITQAVLTRMMAELAASREEVSA